MKDWFEKYAHHLTEETALKVIHCKIHSAIEKQQGGKEYVNDLLEVREMINDLLSIKG